VTEYLRLPFLCVNIQSKMISSKVKPLNTLEINESAKFKRTVKQFSNLFRDEFITAV
jgi:hypothetical protein